MTTDEFRLYHEQTFDSFSKRVIKHIAIDIHNAEAALSKVEVSLSALPYSEAGCGGYIRPGQRCLRALRSAGHPY